MTGGRRTAIERLEALAVGSLGLGALLVACWSTATRYFAPALAPDWGDEVVVYLAVWALWLTCGRLVRRNEHVCAEILALWLPQGARRLLEILHAVLGLAFCAVMAWAGVEVVQLGVRIAERSESSLQLPLALYYASMPTGMLLMASAYALRLSAALRGRPLPASQAAH